MSEHNYKYGEEIEVQDNNGNWIPARFIGNAIGSGEIIIVEYGTDVHRKLMYTSFYRPIQKPELVPWGPGDITPGAAFRHKEWNKGNWALVSCAYTKRVSIGGLFISYDELLNNWETLDGKPCGKEVA